MDGGWGGLAPVGTGASLKEGAPSTKEVPAGEGSGKVRLGGRASNQFNGLGMGRFPSGRERRAVHGWHSRQVWRSNCTLRGGLWKARIGGIGNAVVPGRTESGEDFWADRPGAIKGGELATTVDAERMGAIAASHDRLLKAPFRPALISTSVGGAMMEESANWARLCLFFA